MLIKKIRDTSGLVTTTVFNTKSSEVEIKLLNTNSLVTKTVLNTKISEVENKVTDYAKYITTAAFNKLTAEKFRTKLKQADLVNKTDFNNKLTSFNRKIVSNRTIHLEVQKEKKKLNSLITKERLHFFLWQNLFTSNDESQNNYVYQPTLETLETKKD